MKRGNKIKSTVNDLDNYYKQTLQEVEVQTSCLAGSYNIHGGIVRASDSCIQFVHHLQGGNLK